MSKVHCILCDRKDPFMWHIRLPRNKITVPVCPKCADKYEFWARETICLADVIGPVIDYCIHNIRIKDISSYDTVIDDIFKILHNKEEEGR